MPEQIRFRDRGREVTRLEAFSDVVFGFALTLIVVSLEVPRTFAELAREMRGFFGFAICFAILMWVWHAHHVFFRRYALTDGYTFVVNTILLFVVLLYVYPLKFLFGSITGAHQGLRARADVVNVFILYGLGFAGIFFLFTLLYRHAYAKREELELNAVEIIDTRMLLVMYASYVAIGLASVVIAIVAKGGWLYWAGGIYWAIGPVSYYIGAVHGKARTHAVGSLPQTASP